MNLTVVLLCAVVVVAHCHIKKETLPREESFQSSSEMDRIPRIRTHEIRRRISKGPIPMEPYTAESDEFVFRRHKHPVFHMKPKKKPNKSLEE